MHPKVESGKSRSVNLNLCARMPLPTKCVADVSQAVSTDSSIEPCRPTRSPAAESAGMGDVAGFRPGGGRAVTCEYLSDFRRTFLRCHGGRDVGEIKLGRAT